MFILNLIDIMKILNMQRSILSTNTKTVINKWLFKKKKENLSTENLRMISGTIRSSQDARWTAFKEYSSKGCVLTSFDTSTPATLISLSCITSFSQHCHGSIKILFPKISLWITNLGLNHHLAISLSANAFKEFEVQGVTKIRGWL